MEHTNKETTDATHARKSIIKHEGGVVLIMFGLMINLMVLCVSLSMDLGRGYMARSAIALAADSAVLAAALQNGDVGEAQRYFEANLPPGYLSIGYNFQSDVAVTVQGGIVRVTPTNFSVPGFFNTNVAAAGAGSNINVGGGSAAQMPNSQVEVAHFSLVLDVSGSMSGSKILGLRDATNALIAQLDQANQASTGQTLKMGISTYNGYAATYYSNMAIDPTDDAAALQQFADARLTAGGVTNGEQGLVVGNQHLALLPADENKIVVFMTDGMMNRYGNPPQTGGAQAIALAQAQCDAMKANFAPNVSIWTIGFGTGFGGSAQLLQNCASSPDQALTASTNSELMSQFNNIFSAATKTRLVE